MASAAAITAGSSRPTAHASICRQSPQGRRSAAKSDAAPILVAGDSDGIVDAQDACPDEAGVASDDAKKNGCPPDKDNDGIIEFHELKAYQAKQASAAGGAGGEGGGDDVGGGGGDGTAGAGDGALAVLDGGGGAGSEGGGGGQRVVVEGDGVGGAVIVAVAGVGRDGCAGVEQEVDAADVGGAVGVAGGEGEGLGGRGGGCWRGRGERRRLSVGIPGAGLLPAGAGGYRSGHPHVEVLA